MPDEFYALQFDKELNYPSELRLDRARRLAAAVARNRDCSLVRLMERGSDDTNIAIIEFDLETHGVPSLNTAGIGFRERIALVAPSIATELIRVLVLRKSFPSLMHQNATRPNQPRELCLYFEAPRAVLRTWTPEAFIRRIQWWLEMAAKGTLHAADQPAEQMFFASSLELVLPWNLDALRADIRQRFHLVKLEPRPNGGQTLFLLPSKPNDATSDVSLIEVAVPLVVHGRVESSPGTLGELVDALAARKVDLLGPLTDALRARVGTAGVKSSAAKALAVILLHIPIARTEGEAPTNIQRRAFALQTDLCELGVDAGALFKHEGCYYRKLGALGGEASPAWREHEILQADVLVANTAAAARRQSGIRDEGPQALLVGVGSLGSALLQLWGRSGWGTWTVVDGDYIRPHNLSRHTAFACHIGVPKVSAVEDLHNNVMQGATSIRGIIGDAEDANDPVVRRALRDHKLIVDASADIGYPRYASTLDDAGRHVATFLTPSGNACVLMAESHDRAIRLRTLEGQYYRALIHETWGRDHLVGNRGSFFSGGSCRDISVVISYARIVAHAGLLAEQVRRAANDTGACIRVWQSDPDTGAVVPYNLTVAAGERSFSLGRITAYIDEGLVTKLRAVRAAALPNETGGALLGFYDFSVDALVFVDALPAPPDSKSSPAAFERGVVGLAEAVREAARRTANVVGYVGEWHSHPLGLSAAPSRDDLTQLIHLALGMSEDGLPAFQLIVGEGDLQISGGAVS